MIGLQAEKHDLIDVNNFRSVEEFVLHLIHSFAYAQASAFAKDKTVLDLGCNTGYGTEILSKTATKVVGVDVSKEAISTAKKQYGNLDIDFHLIDGKQLPFDNDEFDVIISCQVIEHIVDYNIYLNELKRVLSPTGIVIFTTPNALLRLDPGMKPWNKFHVCEFSHSELQLLLETHFSAVQTLGLFAEETTYLVEKNRLSRARERARKRASNKKQRSHYHQLRSIIKRAIPNSILEKFKALFASSPPKYKEIEKSFMDKHGLNDFYYRIDELESALDLFALCSNDASAVKGIDQKLKMA